MLRVLMIEDSADDAELILDVLREGGLAVDSLRVETAAAMQAALDGGNWDVILSDYNLPGFSAAEALVVAKDRKLDLPFIIVSGCIGEEAAVGLMKAGAHDFVMKESAARLVPAVHRGLMETQTRRQFNLAQIEFKNNLQNVKEQERARIAREIHDDLGGTLTAIKFDLLWLHQRLHEGQPKLQEKVAAIDLLVDRALEATAKIARDLRPGILDFGIVAAIEWQAREFQSRTGIRCETTFASEEIPLDPDLSVNVFRIFQETLTNITKHANASVVRVAIGASNGWLNLEVRDNGRGITGSDMAKPKSFGIRGMLERARNLGGDIEIRGVPGQETTLSVRLPVTQACERAAEQRALF